MKITKTQLKQIIKEELTKVLNEDSQLELALGDPDSVLNYIKGLQDILGRLRPRIDAVGDLGDLEGDLKIAEEAMTEKPPEDFLTFGTGVNNLVFGVAEKLLDAGEIDEDYYKAINAALEAYKTKTLGNNI